MGWDGSSESYLSNALTVNKSLVFNIEKKKTSRKTDRPEQTGPERYVSVSCMCMNGMIGMNKWNGNV